jgi:hypothetical protein
MASELHIPYGIAGQTVYAIVRDLSGDVWNGSAFETYAAGNFATYDVAATEQGSSGFYVASFPGSISAGVYNVTARDRSGGTPAESDPVIAQGSLHWDGSAEVDPFNHATDTVDLGKVSGDATAADNLEAMLEGLITGSVDDSNFTPTTTAFETDLTEASDDHFNNQAVLWRSGDDAGLTFFISDSVGKTGLMAGAKLTVDTMPNAPANGDTFEIIGTKGA